MVVSEKLDTNMAFVGPKKQKTPTPEVPQREAKNESNRSKVESRKIDSESPSESRPANA